jgi:hypothetical protein
MNPLNERQTWMGIGASQGAKLGFFLALAYVCTMALSLLNSTLQMLPQVIVDWASNSADPLMTPDQYIAFLKMGLFGILMMLIFGIMIGGIPATGIGCFSGIALGWLLSHPTIAPSPKSRLTAGGVFGVVITLTVTLIAYPHLLDGNDPHFYWMFVGVPSIFYIGACLVLSHRIALLAEHAYAKESPVTLAPLPLISE